MADVDPKRVQEVLFLIDLALKEPNSGGRRLGGTTSPLLVRACQSSCDLLADWVEMWWSLFERENQGGPSLNETVRDAAHWNDRLGPQLAAMMIRVGCNPEESRRLVDGARRAVEATARREPRLNLVNLTLIASNRLRDLRAEVCRAAGDLANRPTGQAEYRLARTTLVRVRTTLLAILLTLASVGPHAAQQNLTDWGNLAVETICLHEMARSAQPGTVRRAELEAGQTRTTTPPPRPTPPRDTPGL